MNNKLIGFGILGFCAVLGLAAFFAFQAGSNSPVLSNSLKTNNSSSGSGNVIPQSPVSTNSNSTKKNSNESPCIDAGQCDADAQIYCSDEWSGQNIQASWKLDLVQCLYDEHKEDISVTCRESLECRQQLNEELLAACQEDKQKFCSQTRPSPGSEPLVDCLGEHFASLSTECATAWTRHDSAKPN